MTIIDYTCMRVCIVLFHFTQDGDTALLLACRYGHSSVVKLLTDNGTNVNYQNELNVRL